MLHSGESLEFQILERLVGQLSMEAEIHHGQVDVVVVQLLEYVEIRIVPRVSLIRVESSRGVQCIGIRVDVEITLDLAGDSIDVGRKGSRSLLLTVGSIGHHRKGKLLADVVGGVEICSVTGNAVLQGPAPVVHGTQGSIVMSLVVTGGNRHRVVVLHIVGEQKVKPVGIAVLGFTEIGRLGLGSIGKGELTGHRIILAEHLVHLAVDTAVGSVRDVCIVQIALLLEFLVDGHLILRVHDVERIVGRLEPVGIFTGVTDAALACGTFLGGDDDDAGHRPCTVDRGCGTILEDLEALDVVGVESCNR